MGNSCEKYAACHKYVKAVEDLPPTYSGSDLAKTFGIPDPINDKMLSIAFDRVDIARQNVINKCGFDPDEKLKL